jgi:hypothetical protein
MAALLIAGTIQGRQHFAGELTGFAQHLGDEIGGQIGERALAGETLETGAVLEEEHRLGHGRLIGHALPPACRRSRPRLDPGRARPEKPHAAESGRAAEHRQ